MISLSATAAGDSIEQRELFLAALKFNLPDQYVLLQTCNRVELYADDSVDRTDPSVLRHLCCVAAGLCSTMPGEVQIQQQVKSAYNDAINKGTISTRLHSLFQQALRISKQVRTETLISRGAMSYSQAAIEVIRSYVDIDLANATVTVIGVNNLNRAFIKFLKKAGASAILVGNRTYEKASALAEDLNCRAFNLHNLSEILAQTDILISATSAPHYIVNYDKFPADRKMLILDLAVPRDVDPAIGARGGVELLNLEDIEAKVERNLDKRRLEIEKALSIIDQEIDKLFNKHLLGRFSEKVVYGN